jgi:uncharacterized protein YndB with AHSA1/START domain
MPVIQHTVQINRPVTEIFRFVADFNNSPQWFPPTVQLQKSGQLKVGEMVVGTRRLIGRSAFVNADVVDYVPNQRIAYTGIMGSYPFRTTFTFNFASSGTQVTEVMDVRIFWIYFFVRPFIVSALDSQIRTSLENLKTVMEARFK